MENILVFIIILPILSAILVAYIEKYVIIKLKDTNSFKKWWRKHIVEIIDNNLK